MKTITKKTLSVLMALLVLLGGVWVSFAIEPAAENIEYDTTYDYSTVNPDNYGAWNYTNLGAEDINRQGTNENSFFVCRESNTAPGLNVSYGGLNVEWGANGEAYLVYKVAGGTKFEASFFMKDVDSRNRWGDTIGEPFEFKIESSASKDSGWSNAVTTKDEVGTASSTAGKYDIVLTYDVPENCEYVKITFPQKGLLTGTTARLNDMAYLTKVRFFKVKPIKYDTAYDYSTLRDNTLYDMSNLADTGAYEIGGTQLYKEGSNPALNPGWGQLKVTWGEAEKSYIVYKVAADSKFEATVKLAANNDNYRKRYETATGEPFEFVIEASANGTDGWQTIGTTAGNNGTPDPANGAYADIVLTCDVPDNCNFVKITFPQQGILPGTTDTRLNDMARLCGVRFFKYVAPAASFDTAYDYSEGNVGTEITDANKGNYGIYALNPTNAHKLYSNAEIGGEAAAYSGGIGGGWGDLGTTWGSKNAPYVIYNVKAGSTFEATFRMLPGRSKYVTAAGEPLEAVIVASDSATGGWKNEVTTAGKDVVKAGPYEDVTITYTVPEDCTFVKITLPLKGTIPNSSYRGNDLARIMSVRYTKYVAPAIPYDKIYSYTDSNNAVQITDNNKASFGIHAINNDNAHKLYSYTTIGGAAAAYSGGIGGDYGDLGTEWGTKNAPYVIYKVQEGSKFEANLRLYSQANRDKYSASTGELVEVVIEASANGTDGWKNAVNTKDKTGVAAGSYLDVDITYDVPEDCNYVKITLPLKGIIPETNGYRGNDLARIMGVKYFSYVDPATNYDTIHDYSDATANTVEVTTNNMANYGIVGLNPDNAAGLVAPAKAGNAYDGGIGGNYSQLGGAWGSKNRPYVIYRVNKGTKFEATFRTMPKATRERYADNTGESMEITIEASNSLTGDWKNLVDTTGLDGVKAGSYEDITITYDVPADCQYVKITLPLSGIITGTYRGNDYARIMGVKYFKYVPPVITYDTTHDYSDTTVATTPINGSNLSAYGIHAYNNSGKAPAMYLNEAIGNPQRGGIGLGYGGLAGVWGQVEQNFVIYEVKPGTFFELTARMISSKADWSIKTGEPFEFTIEASSNDMNGWKNKVDTSSVAGVVAGGYKDHVVTYEVPADCSFVKVTFPQKGVIPGTNVRGNDAARIMKVRLSAAKNFYEGTDTVMNYKANGEVDFFYDNDAALIYFYKTNGIVVNNFSNGAAYAAPSMEYLNSGTGIAKPYIMYAVEGNSKFVAGVNVNRDAAAALGADFVMKFYESVDGASWTEVTVATESVGDTDYYTFNVAANSKYVKIEYPHTDAVKATDKVNEVYGLIAVGFNPNESAYEITNPYGNYKFNTVDKYYGEAFATQFNAKNYGIYDNIGGVFFYEAAIGSPYYYLAYGYGQLVNNTGSDPCGLVYSVVPGTAFQAVVLTSRDNGDSQIVEKATGKPFVITVQISSDGKKWTDYNPSRILTENHLMDSTPGRYVTEVMTIPTLPADAKFVRLMYPQTASIKVMTNGMDGRAGNDFIGLAQVSFTKGNAVPPYLYEPDQSKYDQYLDFTEGTHSLVDLNATGVAYDAGLGSLSPSWGYFYNTGEAIRERCAVTVSVKEGSAFYVDFCYRPERIKEMAGEDYRVKLLFSSDMNNWTDVTDKYIEVGTSDGALTVAHRFEIDKLPAGVKYVKVEYPHNRDLRGYVTKAGVKINLMGNDSCGIKRIGFTGENHFNFEHEIQYGYWFEEYTEFPEDITEENAKVIGIYDFSDKAFKISDYTGSEAYDGRITVKESYLYNKTEVEKPYIVYNVKPGTEFYMKVMTSASASRLTVMPNEKMKIYASETGEDGSWTEITNYFHNDVAANSETQYYIHNVGAKTNFIKVEFPNDGDLVAQGKADGASGAGFYTIKEVKASLVNFDPTWDGDKAEHNFKKPTLNNKVDTGDVVVVDSFPWLWLWIGVGAGALVLAAAAVVVIILIVKKKKKNNA